MAKKNPSENSGKVTPQAEAEPKEGTPGWYAMTYDREFWQVDGYDECVAGVVQVGGEPVLCYDVDKIIARLEGDGMSREEAWEYFEYNIRRGVPDGDGVVFLEK